MCIRDSFMIIKELILILQMKLKANKWLDQQFIISCYFVYKINFIKAFFIYLSFIFIIYCLFFSMPLFCFILISFFLLINLIQVCLLYTSPSPRDKRQSRMPSSA
eukprot:TRINITY_DN870_c0_g1_i8.p2 TRINITY_DN870_c0_g1~~TRINITY_DN870_c0_g1_i8.p2  ORF type:complete len:105 (-),score=38.06 TRINITY_DN870_c0_g1_i8:32-346(-)